MRSRKPFIDFELWTQHLGRVIWSQEKYIVEGKLFKTIVQSSCAMNTVKKRQGVTLKDSVVWGVY